MRQIWPLAAASLAATCVLLLWLPYAHEAGRDWRGFARLDPGQRGERVPARVVIVVFPSTVDPKQHEARVAAINETWGGDPRVRLGVLGEGLFARPDALRNRHAGNSELIKWAVNRSLELWPDVDWWMKADDLTYVVVPNLLGYLASRRPGQVQLLGRRLQMANKGDIFCSGGAGYVLSRAAVDRLLESWCLGGGWLREQGGDIALANCLSSKNASYIADTRDGGTEERFHAYGPQRLISGQVDKWYKDYTPWYSIPAGPACCSARTVTFHYVEHGEARAIHSMLSDRERFLA
eukprot:gene23166-35495_t